LEEAARLLKSLAPGLSTGSLPLLIGGAGERLSLPVVARHADEWSIWGTPGTMKRKGASLDACCGPSVANPPRSGAPRRWSSW